MKTFSIGPVEFDLIDFLETDVEEDTLVAYPPDVDFVTLRFTVLSLCRDDNDTSDAGRRFARRSAIEDDAELREIDDKIYYEQLEPASEGPPGSLMRFWYVGFEAHFVVISCFVDGDRIDDPLTRRVLDSVNASIQSIRNNSS